MIVSDGEGATKVVRISVTGAGTEGDAERVARTIATSQHRQDRVLRRGPELGRIVAAAGRAGVKFDPEKMKLYFDGTEVFFRRCEVQAGIKVRLRVQKTVV